MRSFEELYEIAVERKGGSTAVEEQLSTPKTRDEIIRIPDDRWLSMATRCVFQAGFSWKVVDNMWPGFEVAFKGFDIETCAAMDEVWFDALLKDTGIIRYGAKIQSVQKNALFMQDLTHNHGSASIFFADWPADNFAGLLLHLKKHATRLGGTTGQYYLRTMGIESYILTRDVIARLVAEGVIDKAPTSKASFAQVQEAFNRLKEQSGRSLNEISRILALTTG